MRTSAHRTRRITTALTLVLVTFAPAAARAADPVAFAAASGVCDGTDGYPDNIDFGTMAAAHPDVMLRVQSANAPMYTEFLYGPVGAGDDVWTLAGNSMEAGQPFSVFVSCPQASAAWTAQLYDPQRCRARSPDDPLRARRCPITSWRSARRARRRSWPM